MPNSLGRSASLASRAAHAGWWSALEIAARYGTQLVLMVVLARLLPAETFGLIAMLLVFTSIGALLVDSGFGVALVQRRTVNEDDEATVFAFSITAGLVTALLLWACAPAIARFYEEPQLVSLLVVLSVILPLNALATVPDALLTKRLDFRARTSAELVGSLVSGVLAIVLAFQGFGVWSLVFQAVAASVLRTTMLWLLSKWRPRGRFSVASFRRLLGFGGYMLLTNLLDTITIRLQSVLIGKMYDSGTLGYYTIAQNTQQAPASFFGSILSRVGLPVFASIADDQATLRDALRASIRASMYLFMPCMLGISVLAAPLVSVLYGQRWLPAAPILSILSLASLFWPMHVLNLAAISAQGRSDLFFRLAVLKKLIAIALIIAASPFGAIAMAWAVFAASLIATVVNTYYTAKFLEYGFFKQMRDLANTMAGAFMAAIAGYCVLHFNPPSPAATGAAIGLAALVYIGWSLMTRSPAMRDLLGVARRICEGAGPVPAQPAESP